MTRFAPLALGGLAIVAFLAYGSLTSRDSPEFAPSGPHTVRQVHDGDTLTVNGIGRVRLAQVDAPELGDGECYAAEAFGELRRLAPRGSSVAVVTDLRLDRRDRFGRTLGYVVLAGDNLNIRLAERGAVAPYFFRGDRGRYADQLLAAARQAKAAGRGLWGRCPGTKLDPTRQVDTSH